MPATTSMDLTNLDFQGIKSSFRNYLKNQPQFKDYNFEGSNLNVLLDVLAYNTFKNLFYTNMLVSESFLDTAQLRSSVVSHAKELNYTPRSAKSSKARIKVDFTATGDNQPYIIQKGQTISAIVKNTNLNFTIPETMTVSSSNTTFSFETDIYEGIYVKDTSVYQQSGNTIPRFRLTNKNVDLDSLTVVVYTDDNVEGEIYMMSRSLLDLDHNDAVFFVQCDENEYYEIFFGDNVLGKKPKEYSTIVMDYRVTEGKTGDNASTFVLNFNPTETNSGVAGNELTQPVEVTTIDISRGGGDVEDIESIRYYAPRAFQVQERVITSQDYETALKVEFPEINAVHAYGGEDAVPPEYGRVYVAIDIANVDGLPELKKKQYLNFLKRRSPFSIEPKIIIPEYSYLQINSTVRYNVNITKVDANVIETLIVETIRNFNESELDDFAVIYRSSQLATLINEADTSIISSIFDTILYKRINIPLGTPQSLIVKFDTQLMKYEAPVNATHSILQKTTFHSSDFSFLGQTCILEDNGHGEIILSSSDGVNHSKIYNVGSINYETGELVIENFQVDTFTGSSIKFYVKTRDPDIQVKNNTILTIENDEIHVTVEPLRE